MSVGATIAGVADIVWRGSLLGLQFNPVFAVAGAALAAGLIGYPRAPRERGFWAGAAIIIAWLIGDGLMVLARARDAYDGAALLGTHSPVWATVLLLALWAVVGALVGYVLPAWAGVTVGRRVTHGTGWLAAMAVTVGVSLGVSSLVAALGVLA